MLIIDRHSFPEGKEEERDSEKERFLFPFWRFIPRLVLLLVIVRPTRGSIERDNNMQLFSRRTVINFIIKFSCLSSLSDIFDLQSSIELLSF